MNKEMLRERMKQERWNGKLLALEMGMSQPTLREKIAGRSEFKASEIRRVADILGLSDAEIIDIFLPKK